MSQSKFIVTLIIVLLFMITISLTPHLIIPRRVQAATTNITLYGYLSGWTSPTLSGANPTITVTQGDTISFTVIGGDSYYMHRLLIDVDNSSITSDCPNTGPDQCSGIVNQGQTSTVAPFAAPAPGTYFYYCTFHSPAYMVGKFVVKVPTPDFAVTANPTSIGPLNPRVNGTSTIAVAPMNGFSGTVMLTASPSSGLNATLNPTSIPAASGMATLTVNSTRAGSYSVIVTGNGSSGIHSVTITVTVVIPDFKIAISSPSLTIAPGSSGSLTVTLTSLNGFSGTVLLASTSSSSGPQVAFNPVSVALSSTGSATSTLSVSAMSSGVYSTPLPTGNYNVNVTGTSGSLVHFAELALTVGSSSGAGALPTAAIIGGGIAAALAIIGVAVFALRRRPRTKA